MSKAVAWNLELSVVDGRIDDFRSLMQEMVESTRSEPGARTYEWFLSEDGATCHIREGYADSAAVLAHLGTFGTRFAERFLACVQPTALYVYGEPDEEAQNALNGFGAVYLQPWGGFSG